MDLGQTNKKVEGENPPTLTWGAQKFNQKIRKVKEWRQVLTQNCKKQHSVTIIRRQRMNLFP